MAKTAFSSPDELVASLPEDRRTAMNKLRQVIKKNLPKGFTETISYGMLSYVVPQSAYPNGYHCDPRQPLPFLSLASQKGFVALYHMGMYADPKLLNWFTTEFPKHSKQKLDMGKSCVRFKKVEEIPYELIADLVSKMSPKDWISLYEKNLRR